MLRSTLTAAALSVTLALTAAGGAVAGSAKSGSFYGVNNHVVTGGASIVSYNGGHAVKLGSDFVLDGAPDPKVGFGSNGRYVDGTLIGKLTSNTGEQLFPIPAGMDISQFNEVHIWCEKFSVGLGVAPIN